MEKLVSNDITCSCVRATRWKHDKTTLIRTQNETCSTRKNSWQMYLAIKNIAWKTGFQLHCYVNFFTDGQIFSIQTLFWHVHMSTGNPYSMCV